MGQGFLDDPLQLCMRFSGNAIHLQSNGVLQARAAGESRETAIDGTPVDLQLQALLMDRALLPKRTDLRDIQPAERSVHCNE